MPASSVLSKRKEAFLRGLAHKSVRGHRGSFLAEGSRVVQEALSGRWRVTDIVGTPSAAPDIERWQAEGRLAGVRVSFTDERTFETLADSVHPQGVLAVVEEPRLRLEKLPARAPVLLLDGVQDPGNAGTLLRSLRATGGSAVVALKGSVDLFNPKAVRGSAGSLFHLAVATQIAAGEAAAWLRARSIPLLALDPRGESLFDLEWEVPPRFALAVGNESAGISEGILSIAAARVSIPMAPGVESLNAAVAGSVALYELRRRRLAIDRRERGS